jgi:prevent-host-death family protein
MGKPMLVADDIVPIGEFKAHASQMLKRVRSSNRPLVITQNGKPSAVVITPEEFDVLSERRRFIAAVEEGIRDAEAGRIVTTDELERELNERFNA